MRQVEQYRSCILRAFDGLPIALSQPEGGYALWVQLPKTVDSLALYYTAKSQGITVVPGHVFGEDERYRHFIRLNAGHELTTDVRQAISDLAEWSRQQMKTVS
ncbi:putative HTH-type transcriptional regulator YjiR [compost metagenome]